MTDEIPDEEDVEFVISSETGMVVSICSTWEEAKEALEEAQAWPDEEDYTITEYEDGYEPTLTELD